MKLLLPIALLFFGTVFSQDQSSGSSEEEKLVEVVLGIDKVEKLDFTPSAKVQVGNDSIMGYQLIPQKREITFKGLKPGKTSVILRDTVGDIKARFLVNITANDQSKVVRELRDFLGDVEGLEIGVKGDSVYVGGHIVVPNDIGKVVVVLDKYPDVMRLVELSPQTQGVIARKMQDEIQKSGLADVTVRVVNGLFWLEGIVSSDPEVARALAISAAYIPDRIESLARRTDSVQSARREIIQNFIQVNKKSKPEPIPKLVKITAQFVELSKNYGKIFGFKWQPFLSEGQGSISFGKTNSGGVSTDSNGSFTGTISNLFPKLASAKSAGYARVLQSGVVIIKENIRGEIKKRETKPFSIGSGEFARPQDATARFELAVTPALLQEEKIDLNISLTVSSVAGDPPETLENTINTTVVVKSKESAVIGGIVVTKNTTDFDKNAPGGVDQAEDGNTSSALFSFVRSKSYSSTRSQFVVFMTPEIIDSASDGTDEIKRKFKKRGR
jgi:pilus assembly protein CpaC